MSDPAIKPKPKKSTFQKERAKLDQIVKLLFSVSKKTLVNAVNGLFGENYDPNSVEINITKTATEYVKNNLDIIRADLFIEITVVGISKDYHLEFQLSADSRMIVRMFEYDIQHALDKLRLDDEEEKVLELSKSMVIHFEPSGKIPNKYKMKVKFSNGTIGEYEIDVVKFAEYSSATLLDKHIYNLIPLELFLLRIDFEKAKKSRDRKLRTDTIAAAKAKIDIIVSAITDLKDRQEISFDDYSQIITGLSEITRYLDKTYNLKLGGEIEMIKTIVDEKILNRAKQAEERLYKVVKNMLLKNTPIDEIIELTDFTELEIKDIQKSLNKVR